MTFVKIAPTFKEFWKLKREPKSAKDLKALLGGLEFAREVPRRGMLVEKARIPKHYVQQFDVHNLFEIKLENEWRFWYTILTQGKETHVIVMDAGDQRYYNKIFGNWNK